MTDLTELSFRQRIENLKKDLNSEKPELPQRLNEKGVEAAYIVPLLECIMGFDPIQDIQYERTSTKQFERFDFLIDDCLIIEAKRLGSRLGDVHKQIQKYISHHDEINYGILTNASDYSFFIQKDFIKQYLGPGQKFKISFERNVFHVLKISIFDDQFLEVIKLFSKNTYHELFIQMARFVLTRINSTRTTKIVNDKALNSWLQKSIEKTINVQHGEYLKDLENGKVQVGQTLRFDNGFVSISVKVQNDGRVMLSPGEARISDMMKTMDSEFEPMIKLIQADWKNESDVFSSTKELIKKATGREKLRKGKYVFV